MRKLISSVAAIALCFFISCNDSGKADNSQAEKNIKASDMVSKAFETGNVSAIDSVVADDFVDHTDQGDKKGKDSLKAMITVMHAHFKDMKMEKIHELADGDYVYSRMRYTGTSDGSMGMPPGPYDIHAIEVAKFKDGKAVEHWSFMDMQSMMKMMQPGMQPGMDKMENKMEDKKMDTSKKM